MRFTIDGLRMAINYGLNRVRFPAAVRAGSRIRARIVLQSMRDVADATEAIYSITIESQRLGKTLLRRRNGGPLLSLVWQPHIDT